MSSLFSPGRIVRRHGNLHAKSMERSVVLLHFYSMNANKVPNLLSKQGTRQLSAFKRVLLAQYVIKQPV